MTEQSNEKATGFEAARPRLFALAYRMLGSRAEAEDVVQDVWLKWHLADTQAVLTPVAWLTTLTTRAAIDRLRHLQRERASQETGWLPEPWLDELAPSAEELALRAAEMSSGVMLLLERLKPEERAAFVLHEAFDCDYAEIASILERSRASCRQIVHRAKERLQRGGAPLTRPDPAAHARIVERLRSALEAQDRAGLMRLFSDAPEVVGNETARVAQPVAENWADQVSALAMQAGYAEVVTVDGAMGIALLREGNIVAMLDISTDGAARIVGLRVVTSAARLQAVNRVVGRAAVTRLLARLQHPGMQQPGSASIPVRGHFPVDIHA